MGIESTITVKRSDAIETLKQSKRCLVYENDSLERLADMLYKYSGSVFHNYNVLEDDAWEKRLSLRDYDDMGSKIVKKDIPDGFIEKGLAIANGGSCFGILLEDMTRTELIAIAAYAFHLKYLFREVVAG